jgi:hypothetical protein
MTGRGNDDQPGPDAGLDSELRRRFAALRRQEAETAPGFGALWRRAVAARGRHPRPAPLAALAAVAVAIALAALIVVTRPWARIGGLPPAAPPQAGSAPLITAWRSPTDFLLRTPGEEVLSSTPSFGGDLFPGAAAQPRPPRTPKSRPETHRRSWT